MAQLAPQIGKWNRTKGGGGGLARTLVTVASHKIYRHLYGVANIDGQDVVVCRPTPAYVEHMKTITSCPGVIYKTLSSKPGMPVDSYETAQKLAELALKLGKDTYVHFETSGEKIIMDIGVVWPNHLSFDPQAKNNLIKAWSKNFRGKNKDLNLEDLEQGGRVWKGITKVLSDLGYEDKPSAGPWHESTSVWDFCYLKWNQSAYRACVSGKASKDDVLKIYKAIFGLMEPPGCAPSISGIPAVWP